MEDRIFKAFHEVKLSETKKNQIIEDVVHSYNDNDFRGKFWQSKTGGALVVAIVAVVFVFVNVMLVGQNTEAERIPLDNSGNEPATEVCSHPEKETESVSDSDVSEQDISFVLPVKGGIVTADFGEKYNVMHYGTDITFTEDKNIYAPAGGVVILAQYDTIGGNTIIIEHTKDIVSEYSALESMSVNVGEVIDTGTVIGVMGNTGCSTGIHLCWKIKINGEYVDPMKIIKRYQ